MVNFPQPLVYVVWYDAAFHQDANEAGLAETHSCGWLMRDDDEVLQIAQSFRPGWEEFEFCEVLTIPREWCKVVQVDER